MQSTPALRRWLALAGTGVIFASVLGLWYLQQPTPGVDPTPRLGGADSEARSWPLWGGNLQRNPVNLVESNMPTSWTVPTGEGDKGKNIKWVVNLGSKAYGGPTIGAGRIFIGTNNNRPRDPKIKGDKGVVMCFRESDGEFLWQEVHDKLPAGRVNDWPDEGITSSAVIEGDRIWYVSNRCEVVCSTVEGKILWKLDMMGKLGVFPHNLATCSPLLVGDTLFVVTSNGVDEGHINIPAPNAPSFIAVNKKNGEVLWTDRSPGRNIMHGQWSNPVYAEVKGQPQIIFPGGDGYIRGFNPANGELLWKFDCNPKSARYDLGGDGTKNDFVSTPIIWENKLYIGVGQDPEHKKGVGHLWCIDITKKPANKDKDLSPFSDPKDPNPKFDPRDPRNKDSGLVWHYGGEDEREDAPRKWYFCRTLSTCAVHEGLCYEADFDGMFFCFDANTGKVLWEHDLKGDTWSSPYIVDGKVYIGNEKGQIHIFKHGKSKKLLATVRMGKTAKVRATPVACNGVLYVISENPCKLWAIVNK